MGLAASQARKQLLTARINNLEWQIQMTNNMKIRYSMEKQALSKAYYKALTNTIGGYRDDRDNVQDLSFENLTRSLSIGNGKFSTMRFVNKGGFEVLPELPSTGGFASLASKTIKVANLSVAAGYDANGGETIDIIGDPVTIVNNDINYESTPYYTSETQSIHTNRLSDWGFNNYANGSNTVISYENFDKVEKIYSNIERVNNNGYDADLVIKKYCRTNDSLNDTFSNNGENASPLNNTTSTQNISLATVLRLLEAGTIEEDDCDTTGVFPDSYWGNIRACSNSIGNIYVDSNAERLVQLDPSIDDYSQAQLISMVNNGTLGIEHCSDYNKDLDGNIFSSVTLEEIGNGENDDSDDDIAQRKYEDETLRMTTFETILDQQKNNYETELKSAQTEMDDLNNFIKNAIEKGFKSQLG